MNDQTRNLVAAIVTIAGLVVSVYISDPKAKYAIDRAISHGAYHVRRAFRRGAQVVEPAWKAELRNHYGID